MRRASGVESVPKRASNDVTQANRTRAGRGAAMGEWEGATLRNSQTKCNGLFPIYGPGVRYAYVSLHLSPCHCVADCLMFTSGKSGISEQTVFALREDVYGSSVDSYFEQLGQLGRVDMPRFKIIVHDLRSLLRRYAFDQSFSADSLGGGRASNANLIPYMVQMGLFVLDRRGAGQRSSYARIFRVFVEEGADAWDRSCDLVCVSLSSNIKAITRTAALRVRIGPCVTRHRVAMSYSM